MMGAGMDQVSPSHDLQAESPPLEQGHAYPGTARPHRNNANPAPSPRINPSLPGTHRGEYMVSTRIWIPSPGIPNTALPELESFIQTLHTSKPENEPPPEGLSPNDCHRLRAIFSLSLDGTLTASTSPFTWVNPQGTPEALELRITTSEFEADLHPKQLNIQITARPPETPFSTAPPATEQLLQHLLATAGDVWFEYNVPEDHATLGPNFHAQLGTTPGSLNCRLQDLLSLIRTDHQRTFQSQLAPILNGITRFLELITPLRPVGNFGERWIILRLAVTQTNQDGKPILLFGHATNHTSTRRIQESLLLEHQHLLSALEGNGIAWWEWFLETDLADVNETWYTMLGYPPNSFPINLKTYPTRLVHPDDQPKVHEGLMALKEGASNQWEAELRLKCADGGYKWVKTLGVVVARNAENRPIRISGVRLDISRRKEREERQLNAAGIYKAMITAIPDMILHVDANGAIIEILNHRTARPTAPPIPSDPLESPRWLRDIFPAKPAKKMLDGIAEALRTGEAVTQDLVFHNATGQSHFEARHARISDNQALVVLRDTNDATKTRKAIEQNQSQLNRLLESTQEGIWVLDHDWKTVRCNTRMQLLFGYRPGELDKLSFTDFLTEHTSKSPPLIHPGVGLRSAEDCRFICRGGGEVWVNLRTTTLIDSAGTVEGWLVTATDVTQRHHAEADLVARTQLLLGLNESQASLLDPTPLIHRLENAIRRSGEALESRSIWLLELGNPEAPLKARASWAPGFTHAATAPEPRPTLPPRWQEWLGDGAVVQTHGRSLRSDEKHFLASLKLDTAILVPIQVNYKLWGLLAVQDSPTSSARSQIETSFLRTVAGNIGNALWMNQSQETVERLSLAVEQSPSSIFITNLHGEIEFANQSFLRSTGYTSAEVIGNTPRFLNSGRTPKDVYQEMYATIHAGKPWSGQFQNRTRDGHLIWETKSIFPLFNHTGAISHFVAVSENIDERKRAEEQLLESLKHAQEINRLKDNFVSLVSHEFRTPLSAILTASELLEDGLDSLRPEKHRAYLELIKEEVFRLTLMTEGILAMGRIDSGRVSVNPRFFTLQPFIRKIADEIHFTHRKRSPVDLSFHGEIEDFCSDQQLLRHILTNLLSNAYKYSQAPGSVQLVVEATESEIRLKVSDQGLGIPEECLPHIFDAFYRGHNITNAKGTGVGLYVLKRCVDLLGGTVSVQSQVGVGSHFHVSIPRSQLTEPASPPPTRITSTTPLG